MKWAGAWLKSHQGELKYGGCALLLSLAGTAVWLLFRGWPPDFWFQAVPLLAGAVILGQVIALALYSLRHGIHLIGRLSAGTLAAAVILLGAAAWGQFLLEQRDFPGWMVFLPLAGAGAILCLTVFYLLQHFLSPLEELLEGLETAVAKGAGNQMDLSGIPRTELYMIGKYFNQFSLDSRIRSNALEAANQTYRRLVPARLPQLMGEKDVAQLVPGKIHALKGQLLVVLPGKSGQEPTPDWLGRTTEQVEHFQGMVVGYDLSSQGIFSVFEGREQAQACARKILETEVAVAALLQKEAALGVFGGEKQLYPLMVIPNIRRTLMVIRRLHQFGARLLYAGGAGTGLRMLGVDQGEAYYEDIGLRTPKWQARWRPVQPLWEEALAFYQRGDFASAMRKLAGILRAMPQEEASRWYLFRCNALRDCPEKERVLDLLYEKEPWE